MELVPWKDQKEPLRVLDRHSIYKRRFKTPAGFPSRLVFITDKGGKTRTVGILDIFSQSTLVPLQDHLADLLRADPMDGTFDQDAQRERVRVATSLGKRCHSIDMSNCTDRFPVSLQVYVLTATGILTSEQADAWCQLVTDRGFFYKDTLGVTRQVRYAVGHAMGGISTWMAFSYTNGWLRRCAAIHVHLKKFGTMDNFAFDSAAGIGDDVAF